MGTKKNLFRDCGTVAGKNNVPSSSNGPQSHQIFCCAFNANGTVFVTGSSDTLARVHLMISALSYTLCTIFCLLLLVFSSTNKWTCILCNHWQSSLDLYWFPE